MQYFCFVCVGFVGGPALNQLVVNRQYPASTCSGGCRSAGALLRSSCLKNFKPNRVPAHTSLCCNIPIDYGTCGGVLGASPSSVG